MSLVKSVEKVIINIPIGDSSATAAITKGQINSQCVPFTTSSMPSGSSSDFSHKLVTVEVSGDLVTVTRDVGGINEVSIDLTVFVVEYTSECVVQTGEITLLDGVLSTTATITDVIMNRAFTYSSFKTSSDDSTPRRSFPTTVLTAVDTLTFTRIDAGGTDNELTIRWYVVECDATQFEVQRGDFLFTLLGNEATSAAFTAVDMARTMTIADYLTDQPGQSAPHTISCTVDLEDTTHVRARRANGGTPNSGAIDVAFQVIEFAVDQSISVQRADFVMPSTEPSSPTVDTVTITSVDETRSIVHSPAVQANVSVDNGVSANDQIIFCEMDLVNPTTITGQYQDSGIEEISAWEVIEWELEVQIPVIETFTVQNQGGGATSTVLTAPAGLVQNDMIIIVISIDGDSTNPQSTDFTQFGGTSQGTTELYYLIKRATASEPATYTVTWTGSEAGRFTVLRVSGVLQSGAAIDTIDIIGTGATGDATTASTDAITSTVINTLAIAAVSVDGNVVAVDDGLITANGFVDEGTSGSGGGGGAGQLIASKDLPSIGSSLIPTFGTWTAQGFATRMFNLKSVSDVVVERVFSTAITNQSAII